ncbi:hypothetical protein BJ322DRAFT_1114103 [Thelephora terrestris]|uniref:UvrD-like helicase C-terminal domain-containing protein n=1 Tax=Thelephora terrestris TaxID=56493 RepID=A0A9P6H5Y7_9AGAM|nr:hypothetical protein BJ322DRAFT_1114103 [Thelephora terrestris]
MPPRRASSAQSFNTNILEPDALTTQGGLETALRSVQRVCYHDDFSIMHMISELSCRPHVFEYIMSTLDNQPFERLSKWTIARFPAPETSNVMEALGVKLLQRLSSSLNSAERSVTMEQRNELRELRKKTDLSLAALKELDGCADRASSNVNMSPTSRRKSKAPARNLQLNPYPFDCVGVPVPTTEHEVHVACGDLLLRLKGTFGDYLLFLRRPRVSDLFRRQLEESGTTTAGSTAEPIKASLYFDNVEGFGKWRILLSTRAQKYLRDVKRGNGVMFEITVKKLKELSQGHFSGDNQKQLTGPKIIIPVYEAKMTGDTRLVYRIDCIAHGEGETQAISVFGIYTHAKMEHSGFWDTLSRQLERKGSDYIARCTFRAKPLNTVDNVILPTSFPQLPAQGIQECVPMINVCEEDLKSIHSMLVLDKFVILSQALLNSILADRDIAHMFAVSSQEKEIIESTSSCYVIGRSGTGKTTTILFKMLGIERTWREFPDMWAKPRQIFVTQSRVLATKVEEYFLKLRLSVEAASYSPRELREMSNDAEKEMDLIDLDDVAQWRSDLPVKFSELAEDHFPLFITYERLCSMLQNDIREENDNDGFIIPVTPITPGPSASPTSPLSSRGTRQRGFSMSVPALDHSERNEDRLISYENSFLPRYWNHFPQPLTRVLDPALIFGEILGVIKGSEQVINTRQRCLDRDAYISGSRRGMLSDTKDAVYDLFVEYTKLKRKRQEYDAADRTHHILKEFRDAGWKEEKGKKVDFLYVDEVQDNLLIDTLGTFPENSFTLCLTCFSTAVLRTICRNPHGLFWAGDTAQTISIGSSFKFSDLKAFQHRIQSELREINPVEPETHELLVNYRSHGGIINCARSVVELIILYWPHSIDRLQPEWASVDGPRRAGRVWSRSMHVCKLLILHEVTHGIKPGILVRDDAARKRLKEELGDKSIIMTLYESKGLEFNDVFLYNFFKDSTANASQWRLVIRGNSDGIPAPDFDETRHASICTELKFLYVAITRARKKLSFLDDSESAEPMKAYWKDQITVWESTSEVPQLATKSGSQEWIDTAKSMFANKRYAQAKVAYKRAGRDRESAICHAFLLRENAKAVPDDQVKGRAEAFGNAGEAFYTCAETSPPDKRREQLAYYTNAAECFAQGKQWKAAGECFEHAQQYSEAARAYRKGGRFDEMVEVLKRHKNQIEASLHAQLTKVAQMNYFKVGKVKKAQKLFSSEEEAIAFAKDYGFHDAHVELLRMSGMIAECAEALVNRGRVVEAVKTLLTPPRARDRTRRAVEYLTTGLWRYQSFGMDHLTTDPDVVSELLTLADILKNDMREQEANETAMFRARHNEDLETLRILHPLFIQAGNYPAALLCLDPIFASTLPLQGVTAVDYGPELLLHFAYFQLLDRLRREDRLNPGSMRQKIFAFRSPEDDRFLIPARSFLHAVIAPQRQGDCTVTHERLSRVLDREIPEYIHLRAKRQHDAYRWKLGGVPCMTMATRGECSRQDCQFRHEKITVYWFNSRIRSVLMEIRILNLTGFHPKGVIIHWIGVLYSILHPPSPRLGSIAVLDLGVTPESVDGLRVLREWIWQACDRLLFSTLASPFRYIETFIPNFMPVCTMAYDFDYQGAQGYVPRTRMYRRRMWPQCLTRPGSGEEKHLIVRDFAQLLRGGLDHSLILGTLYLRRILVNHIPVDLGPFCDAVERLCGLYILAHRFATGGDTLHGVTLPRSWFVSLLRSRPTLNKDTSHIPHFVHDTIELLRRTDLQREHYDPLAEVDNCQFKNNGLRLTPLYASVYIARICCCLCLLGYNINDVALRSKVLQAIHGLRRQKPLNGAYRLYTEAPDWWGLVKVFTKSLSNSTLDEMVLLLYSKAPEYQGWVSRYVRVVMHDNLAEIPDRLRTKPASNSEGRSVEPENDDVQQQQLDLPEEDVLNPLNDTEVNIDNGGQEEASASPEEIQAVLVIGAAYHRFSKRKQAALYSTTSRLWSLFHKRASSMEWSERKGYKLLMQGPLVHVLVCLDSIKILADHIKEDLGKQLQRSDHDRLEEFIEKSDKASDLQRTVVKLRTRLGHSSPFHDDRSIPALEAEVREVGKLIDRLSEFPGQAATKTKAGIEGDWKLGWDGIVRKTVRGRKVQRPTLTLDKEDLLYL